MVNEYEHVVVCSRSRVIASVARHGIIKGCVVAVGRVTRTRVIGATTVCRVRLPISKTETRSRYSRRPRQPHTESALANTSGGNELFWRVSKAAAVPYSVCLF
ncbi:hypothetical protein QTP88_020670 [Uroleucon formosanum]